MIALAVSLLIIASAAQVASEVPPCSLGNCKSASNCELYGGPKTENREVFDSICLNNVKWAEPRGFGEYDKLWDAGVYKCSCCGLDLYSSEHKYDSKSGWPAYYDTINAGAVLHNPVDGEVVCSRCGAHLGHRFSDGPKQTTGLRDCINSACLNFEGNSSYPVSDPEVTLEPLKGSLTGGSAGEIELPQSASDPSPSSPGNDTETPQKNDDTSAASSSAAALLLATAIAVAAVLTA